MEILAGLLLTPNRKILPLPWYNRAALGLESGTKVNVALATASGQSNYDKRPPDIIVTPLSLDKFTLIRTLTIDMNESDGAIQVILNKSKDKFNICLMETVTIDQRTKHRITLVLESKNEDIKSDLFDGYIREFEMDIKNLGGIVKFGPYNHTNKNIRFDTIRTSTYKDENIPISHICDILYDENDEIWDRFDRNKIVISSTTDARLVRYVFPRKGTIAISIRHADKPAAMSYVSEELGRLGFNILLARVSKSQKISSPDTSVSLIICEPQPTKLESDIDYKNIKKNLKECLGLIDRKHFGRFMFSVDSLSFGHSIQNLMSIIIKKHRRRIIDVPAKIQTRLKSYYSGQKAVIFVSQKTSAQRDENSGIFLKQLYVASVVVPHVIVCRQSATLSAQMSGMVSGFAKITFNDVITEKGREELVKDIISELSRVLSD
jgi:hypothetical protein